MAKKSGKSSKKVHKHEKKQQQTNNCSSIKIMKPRVYITDSSKFKNLVQQLTGNPENSIVISSSPPSTTPISPPAPYLECLDYGYQEDSLDLSFDSSCFSTPVNAGSPDLNVEDSFNYYAMGNSSVPQNMDFASQYKELEDLLMGLNPVSYDSAVCGNVVNQQEACTVYDYDLPCFV